MDKKLKLNNLAPKFGSRPQRLRVGRGEASGLGKTAGRGSKGQQSRTGGGSYVGFEGGQTPLYRRIPKLRGFKNFFKKDFAVINLEDLMNLSESTIDLNLLKEKRLVRGSAKLLKVLGDGDLKKAFKVTADAFSESAQHKIKAAGGEAVLVQQSVSLKK
jgi:large subunit ribosomal protein L15